MVGIKLYARSKQDIHSPIYTTWLYCNSIGMLFRLEKCVYMVKKRGKLIRTEGSELPESRIAGIEDSYLYLYPHKWEP